MLGKILLTLLIMAGAFFILQRRRAGDARPSHPDASNKTAPEVAITNNATTKNAIASELRTGAWLFLVLMVGLGGTLYWLQWRDDHRVLTVNLHRDNHSEPVSYRVYKYQLQERSFTTMDGATITVSANERMEVLGLD